jgi:hypothetical protein
MKRIVTTLGLGAAVALAVVPLAAPVHAALSDADRWVRLPESIYMPVLQLPGVDPNRDRDRDYLKDDLENRLADIWRPYFIFDEEENDTSVNTGELSLQSWEPRIVYQVRPTGNITAPGWRYIYITYGILFRLDGGFRGALTCDNHHSGDSQRAVYELASADGGVNWALNRVNIYTDKGWQWANAGDIAYTARIANANGNGSERPLPKVWMSAGKHHQYISTAACETWRACDEDCAGGAQRISNLAPWGYFTNVGERAQHPMDWGINQPFTNELWHIGYPNEYTWWAAWYRADCGNIFTGGMNPGAGNTGAFTAGGGNTCVGPVYGLFRDDKFCGPVNNTGPCP